MGSKQKTATSTSTSEPWAEQKPYLQAGFKEAQNLYNSNDPQYFPQSTVAGFSQNQLQAQRMGANRAMRGSALNTGAKKYASDVLGGKYLQNPNDDAVFNSIQNKVVPSVNANFANAGRYGSDSHARAMTSELTDAYAPYASQNWQSGLDRMGQMAQYAPDLAMTDYNDINALYDIGSQQQQLAQSELGDAQNRWNYNQDRRFNKLNQYLGLIGGNWGGTTTSAQPYSTPGLGSQLLGGGLGLLGLLG
jgi:hypothetical protein